MEHFDTRQPSEKRFKGAGESTRQGSFDSAMPSLREGMATLRMTDEKNDS